MEIKNLKNNTKKVNVKGKIIEKTPTKTFSRMGGEGKIAVAVLEDETGKIELTLWNEDTEKYKVGDEIEVKNGYVKLFRGYKQLSAGKKGEILKIE